MAQPLDLFAEVVEGLNDLAAAELRNLGADSMVASHDGIRLTHRAPYELTAGVRLVAALYAELRFAVPRPKALLGDAATRRLGAAMTAAARDGGLRSFRLAAAGSESAVYQRLALTLAAATGLRYEPESGAMLLRVRPYGGGREMDGGVEGEKYAGVGGRGRATGGAESGWEVLVRLTERPLSTRTWRVCNRPGGINATVAAAMNQLLGNERSGTYLNLMCGSGTLMVERALTDRPGRLVGIDSEQAAIDCARENLQAARVDDYELIRADVASFVGGASSRPIGSFRQLTADAPWGDAVGTHNANDGLYQALLASAAQLASPGAGFALLSHEVRLLERLLPEQPAWRVESSRRLSHGGHRPALLLLRRV